MANRERGELAVKVGGKGDSIDVPVEERIYTLRPTFDAICELEIQTGKTMDDLFDDIESGRLSGLRAAVWCLLQAEHASEIRTLKDASDWVERAGGVEVVFLHLKTLRDLNEPPARPGTEVNGSRPRKAQAGTGRRSSRARG